MAILQVLCVVMLVSQIEMLPLNQPEKSMLNQPEELILNEKDKSFMSQAEIEIGLLSDFSAKAAISRVKRQVITSEGCPTGKMMVKPFGCMTCEEYEDQTDQDCPFDEKENEIP